MADKLQRVDSHVKFNPTTNKPEITFHIDGIAYTQRPDAVSHATENNFRELLKEWADIACKSDDIAGRKAALNALVNLFCLHPAKAIGIANKIIEYKVSCQERLKLVEKKISQDTKKKYR